MADAYQEITVWNDSTPNHTYLLEGDKCLGYLRQGEKYPIYFSKPINFDKRFRKFKLLSKSPFKKIEVGKNLITVKGSKGDTYFIDPETKTCTCPGFGYHGSCKHIKEYLK